MILVTLKVTHNGHFINNACLSVITIVGVAYSRRYCEPMMRGVLVFPPGVILGRRASVDNECVAQFIKWSASLLQVLSNGGGVLVLHAG